MCFLIFLSFHSQYPLCKKSHIFSKEMQKIITKDKIFLAYGEKKNGAYKRFDKFQKYMYHKKSVKQT